MFAFLRKYVQQQPLVTSICINLLLFIAFYTTFYSRFGTTDDVEMQMILAGKGVLQSPSAYLRYTHLWIGQLLSTLYTYFPARPWYGYYLISAHFVGMTFLLYALLQIKASLFRIAVYSIIFLISETVLLQELQFTSAALTLEMGSIMLLYMAFSRPVNQWTKYWQASAFVGLVFGAMMRWDTFLLAVVLGTPLLLYAIAQQVKFRLSKVIFCILIIGTAWGVDQLHYWQQGQNQAWEAYNEYKQLRINGDILDYRNPNYEWTPSSADDYFYKVGWEYEDLTLFQHWFFADSSVYSYEKFKALQYAFQNCPLPPEHYEEKIWQFFIKYPLNDYVYYGFLVLIFTLLFVQGNRWLYLTLGSTLLIVFGILSILFIYRHLPERVSFPLAFYLFSLAALFFTYDRNISGRSKIFSFLFLTVIALSSLKTVTRKSSKVAFEKMYWSRALDSLDAQSHQLYVGGGDYYMMPTMTPLQSLTDTLFDGFNMLDFGHLANTPTHYQQLETFGIQNIHTEAIGDTSIFLIHRPYSPFMNLYANFIQRHYGKYIEYEIVRHEPKLNVAVYRIKEQERGESTEF